MVNDLNQAQLWDLGQRTCRLLPGKWTSGVFLRRDTSSWPTGPNRERPGRLVRIDRKTLAADPGFFARSAAAFEIDPEIRFEAVTLSPDGTRVAAVGEPVSAATCLCLGNPRRSSHSLDHWRDT